MLPGGRGSIPPHIQLPSPKATLHPATPATAGASVMVSSGPTTSCLDTGMPLTCLLASCFPLQPTACLVTRGLSLISDFFNVVKYAKHRIPQRNHFYVYGSVALSTLTLSRRCHPVLSRTFSSSQKEALSLVNTLTPHLPLSQPLTSPIRLCFFEFIYSRDLFL